MTNASRYDRLVSRSWTRQEMVKELETMEVADVSQKPFGDLGCGCAVGWVSS